MRSIARAVNVGLLNRTGDMVIAVVSPDSDWTLALTRLGAALVASGAPESADYRIAGTAGELLSVLSGETSTEEAVVSGVVQIHALAPDLTALRDVLTASGRPERGSPS